MNRLQGHTIAATQPSGPVLAGERVCIRIADLSILIRSVDGRLRLALPPEVENFCVHSSTPDIEVTARFCDTGPHVTGTLLFDSGGLWRLYQTGDRYAYRCALSATAAPYSVAFFDRDFRRGTIHLTRDGCPGDTEVYPLEYPLDELLVNQWLARGRGVELHACGAVVDGGGYLFVGHSGAGKTTTARLWQQHAGARILSDDRIIVRARPGQFDIYGTPWHGQARLAHPGSAPLRAIFLLRHASENRIVPLPMATAVARLIAAGFPPLSDAAAVAFTARFLTEVAAEVFCGELACCPDARSVECVLDAMARSDRSPR